VNNKEVILQKRNKKRFKNKIIIDIQKNINKYKHRNRSAKKNLPLIHQHKQFLKFNTTIRLNQEKLKINKVIDFPILNNGKYFIFMD